MNSHKLQQNALIDNQRNDDESAMSGVKTIRRWPSLMIINFHYATQGRHGNLNSAST